MRAIITIFSLLLCQSLFAQNPWEAVEESSIVGKASYQRLTVPTQYFTYSLNEKTLRKQLAKAPMEDIKDTRKIGVDIILPLANGTFETFNCVESPCMSPVLSAKFPEIKSYRGYAKASGSAVRLDLSPQGFRAAIASPKGTIYIDPYYDVIDGHYISYYIVDDTPDLEAMQKSCGVDHYEQLMQGEWEMRNSNRTRLSKGGNNVIKSTYRFALACTGAWGTQQGGTKELVMAKMVQAVNRLNQLLEDEIAVKFELIDNNDNLIFFVDNDPYTEPSSGRTTLGQNTDIVNQVIGSSNYDLGHCFTVTCTDVGGVAFGGSACTQNQAAGVSCVGRRNIDAFMISTTAHELGHQFSAGHTWARCGSNPDIAGQFAQPSSCEPGSGRTILSYYGACGSDNLTGGEIPLYHVCTLDQITDFIANGTAGTCGTHVPSDNHHPDVWTDEPENVTIPLSTPFELTGDASDMDGDNMLYSWEQIDTDFSTPLGQPAGNSPLFRYEAPSTSKSRIFPRLADVLAGRDWREERLPSYTREVNFAFVARDDNPTAGGVNWATYKFNADASAGPFTVTFPNQLTNVEVGDSLLIEWNVNNTDNEIINCQAVDIYLSTDGAQSFPNLILAGTPNDGSETIYLPNLPTQLGKIKVKGHGNIFFNINRNTIRVAEKTEAGVALSFDQVFQDICLPDETTIAVNTEGLTGYDGDVQLELIDGTPDGLEYSFDQTTISAGESTNLNLDFTNVLEGGFYNLVIRAIAPGVDTAYQTTTIRGRGTFMGDLVLQSPASGTGGINSIPEFQWQAAGNATAYRLEVATNPSFDEESLIISKDVGLNTVGSELVNISNSTLYYWRVVADNDCLGEVSSEIFTFHSVSLSCGSFQATDTPIIVPSAGTPTVTSEIEITDSGTASDINVSLVEGNHSSLQEVRGTLISPSGTRVILWQGVCPNVGTINAGFDSQSAFPNGCVDANGDVIKPFESLDILNDENIQGRWKLEIFDALTGNGGQVTNFEIQICSNSALNNPFIVNNEVLEVPTGGANRVVTSKLLCQDDNNTASELIYTLVQIPSKGDLTINGELAKPGARFTQADLNNNWLRYQHTGTNEEEDQFVFTVIDGEGGWIEKTIFQIVIGDDFQSNTEDLIDAQAHFEIFPNPASNWIQIKEREASTTNYQVNVLTLDGKSLINQKFSNRTALSVHHLDSGIYVLNIRANEKIYNQKITIVR